MARKGLLSKFSLRNCPLGREFLAEFLSTFILLSFGCGSVAQAVLSKGKNGNFETINWSWGLGVTMGAYVAGGVSGAHMNPAVSLAMACLRKLPWKKLPVYMLAQYLGAFVASICVFVTYFDALNNFDNGNRTVLGDTPTAGIWATYPQPHLSSLNGFGDQIFGTALLLICVSAITDNKNMNPGSGLAPVCIGLVVVVIGMTFGFNCGYAINPARDLGPRIFTAIAGWGSEPFTFRGYNWFWVPVIGSHIGAVLGVLIYQACIGFHWQQDEDDDELDIKPSKHNNVYDTITADDEQLANHFNLREPLQASAV